MMMASALVVVGGDGDAVLGEEAEHFFGIDEVFGAAEGDEGYRVHVRAGGLGLVVVFLMRHAVPIKKFEWVSVSERPPRGTGGGEVK